MQTLQLQREVNYIGALWSLCAMCLCMFIFSSTYLVAQNVTVNASSPTAPLTIQIGHQSDDGEYFNTLGPTTSGQTPAARLFDLHPKWFRIHAGVRPDTTDPSNPALNVGIIPEPEIPPQTYPTGWKGWTTWDFTELNKMVEIAFASGATPVMNIRFAPRGQWTCSKYFTWDQGGLRDTTYGEFATYMANIVRYYNLGSFTPVGGSPVTNPNGTTRSIKYWEIWNEPDSSAETPCSLSTPLPTTPPGVCPIPPQQVYASLVPSEYLKMWNAVTAKMLAADNTIQFIGPAPTDPTPQIPAGETQYVDRLLAPGAYASPWAISIHAYGDDTSTVTYPPPPAAPSRTPNLAADGTLIDNAIFTIIQKGAVQHLAKVGSRPLWFTETNVTADYCEDAPRNRAWTAFGAALNAAVFSELAPLSTTNNPIATFPFQIAENGHQLSMLEPKTIGNPPVLNPNQGNPLLPYWREFHISRAFGNGGTILATTSSATDRLEVLAVKKPTTSGPVEVMIVNDQPENTTVAGGMGLTRTVNVSVSGMTVPSSVKMWVVDKNTPLNSGPPEPMPPLPLSLNQSITFGGYGVVFLEFTP